MLQTDTVLPIEVFPLSQPDSEARPELHRAFKRAWSRVLTGISPRVVYDAFFAMTPPAPGVSLHPSTDAAVPGWVCVPEDRVEDQALLYLHGGAYTMGTAPAYRGLVSQIAARARRTAFILEYPLAPETALPAALDLASAAVERLSFFYRKVGLVGDSAGGGLTLATLAQTTKPSAAVVFSPWTDLSLSGPSIRDRAARDLLLEENALRAAATGYLRFAAADDPRASPLFGIPDRLPPLLIQVGSDEILYDDALRYARQARDRGHDVTLEEWSGMQHVFQQSVEELEAARHALDHAAAFLGKHMDNR
ncbi:alpha/beta hydrolase fold domain-containing protein [Paraburkholderia sp. SOS3]|uniref:alpha/beta hydrolase fold domain-containing protein n=1 Tax=Paraburkholderia sp. SOS3 TaxID=1926494 RepID=UPI0009475180|nr:alpha/beta hydrolase fold domain-containing protein [Paraburkholderia sp. SOS3]APR40348.1 esterase [Paraburkholderia sp. SOS3]